MLLFFLILMMSTRCSVAQTLPLSCSLNSCDDLQSSSMTWSGASDALNLSYGRSICLPDVEVVPERRDEISWSLRANQWRIRNRVGQASLLQGNLIFESDLQTLRSDSAWLSASADGGLDQLCFPSQATWNHASWKVASSHLVYRADSDDIRACDGAFVLYGVDEQPLYGYAKESFLSNKHALVMKDVHATVCPIQDRSWSLSADQLDWYAQEKRAVIRKARLYVYDTQVVTIPKMQFTLGEGDSYGWQVPQVGSYHDNALMVTFPYRLRSKSYQIVAPWVGSGLSIGGLYHRNQQENETDHRTMIRAGVYHDSPNLRYGAVSQGTYRDIFGADVLRYQLLNMRDGWYGQYFYPQFLPAIRPNQDLPSYIDYERSHAGVHAKVSLTHYQKFSGDKVLQDEITVPFLHVLPRLQLVVDHRLIDASGVFEHLVSEPDKDNYPGSARFLGYLGGHYHRRSHTKINVGTWVKHQRVDAFSSWENYNRHHDFWAPNVEVLSSQRINQSMYFDLAYAYTKTVDQSLDPVFQRRWQWLGGQPIVDKLVSIDRVYDRNRLWLGLTTIGLPFMSDVKFSAQHIFDFHSPSVSLSADGQEDPLIQYPSEVSLFSISDQKTQLSSQGVWVWPLRRMQYYTLQWQYKRLKLLLARQPDLVTVQDQVVAVPANRSFSADFDVFDSGLSKLSFKTDYQSGVDRSLKYRFTWSSDRCCWQGKASIILTKWMSQSDDQSVFTGWQPSAQIGISFKGLSSPQRP